MWVAEDTEQRSTPKMYPVHLDLFLNKICYDWQPYEEVPDMPRRWAQVARERGKR
jgi:hypothetical protein